MPESYGPPLLENKKGNCPGCGFTRPEIANLTYAKTFYPHGLRPWDGEWEEPAQDHARFAERDPVPGKSSRAPRPPHQAGAEMSVGRNGHDGSVDTSPDPLLHAPRTKLGPRCRLVAMGTTARLTPRLTHCSTPPAPSWGRDVGWSQWARRLG